MGGDPQMPFDVPLAPYQKPSVIFDKFVLPEISEFFVHDEFFIFLQIGSIKSAANFDNILRRRLLFLDLNAFKYYVLCLKQCCGSGFI
jgi:hypothetical protein